MSDLSEFHDGLVGIKFRDSSSWKSVLPFEQANFLSRSETISGWFRSHSKPLFLNALELNYSEFRRLVDAQNTNRNMLTRPKKVRWPSLCE